MSKKAFFSILIPSKGGENYIENVLKSVLDQEFSDYEIIIGDNNNNDKFKIVIDKFLPNPKIKIVKQTKTIDVTSSWNACLNNASGRYIIMLGDDDCILKNSLKKIYEILSSNNFPEVLTTNAIGFYEGGSVPEFDYYAYKPTFWNFKKYKLDNRLLNEKEKKNILNEIFSLKNYLPLNMQPHIFSKSLSDTVEEGVFKPPCPDSYAVYSMIMRAKTWFINDEPMFSIGMSKKSFGHYVNTNKLDQGKNYLGSFVYGNYHFVPGSLLNDYLIMILIQLRQNNKILQNKKINRPAYLARQLFCHFENFVKGNVNFKTFIGFFLKIKIIDFPYLLWGIFDFSLYMQAFERLKQLFISKRKINQDFVKIEDENTNIYDFTRQLKL